MSGAEGFFTVMTMEEVIFRLDEFQPDFGLFGPPIRKSNAMTVVAQQTTLNSKMSSIRAVVGELFLNKCEKNQTEKALDKMEVRPPPLTETVWSDLMYGVMNVEVRRILSSSISSIYMGLACDGGYLWRGYLFLEGFSGSCILQ